MPPPPIPRPARERLPAWIWGLIVLGLFLTLASVGLFSGMVWLGSQGAVMAEQPQRGVKHLLPDEELVAGDHPGQMLYRNRKTGQQRVVWLEGDDVPDPAWLVLPPGAQRQSGNGMRDRERRWRHLSYTTKAPAAAVRAHFTREFQQMNFKVRSANIEVQSQVNGRDATREAFVAIRANPAGGAYFNIVCTEPAGGRN